MIFEESIYIYGATRKMYSIEEVTNLRKNNISEFAKIKEHLYCPECELPRLSHNLCTTKSSHFSTHIGEDHDDECSFKSEKASKNQLEALQDDEESLERLNERLKSAIISTFSSKKLNSNPFIINFGERKKTTKSVINHSEYAKNYYIPRKRITNGLSEDDTNSLKIFYGRVRMVCKEYYKGYKLYLCNPFDNNQPMICSLYVSKKVYQHLNIPVGSRFNCIIAFFTELTLNDSEGKQYYNGILTDSRKMAYVKLPE